MLHLETSKIIQPLVILGVQEKHFFLDEIFRLTRTFCYAMHRRRLQLLGLFNVNWLLKTTFRYVKS